MTLNGIQFSATPAEGYSGPSFEAHDPSVGDEDTMVGGMWFHPSGIIEHMYVHPSHQRRGIATQMFELAKIANTHFPDKYPEPTHSAFRTDSGEAWAKSVDKEGLRPEWVRLEDHEAV